MEPVQGRGRKRSSWVMVALALAVVAVWLAVNFLSVKA